MTTLTKKSFKEAIDKTRGTKTQIAEYLGVTFKAVWEYCKKHQEFTQPLLEIARRRNTSKSSDIVYQTTQMDITDSKGEVVPALVNSRLKAAELILKTQGKDEGWVEKTEVEHSGETNSNIQINIPKEVGKLLNE